MRGVKVTPPVSPQQPGEPPFPIASVLIVDDEVYASNVSAYSLRMNGYEVVETQDPLEAREIARTWRPDIIILDILMPELDGISLAHLLKADKCDAELMFVTSEKKTATKVRGLAVGDQYLTKPFILEEMVAMVGALARRRPQWREEQPAGRDASDGLPFFDEKSDLVTVPNGRDARLSHVLRMLLRALVDARGEPVSKEQLLWDIWRAEDITQNLVEANVSRLRKKIEINPRQPELIMTTPGGYYYNVRRSERD